MTNDEKIAALEREVAALKAAQPKPAPEPFKPEPYQRYDPTANMSMPRNALEAMVAAEPRGFMRDVALRDARAPNSPSTIPRSSEQPVRPDSGPANTSGWRDATPLRPPPGVAQADKLMDEQD